MTTGDQDKPMADTLQRTSLAPMTEDAFIADRQKFWNWFTSATLVSVITVVIIVILMAIFLV